MSWRRSPAWPPVCGSASAAPWSACNNSTDFYRAVTDGELVSVAEPVHRGRSQQVWVVRTEDADGRLIARGQVRLQNLTP